MKTCSDCGIEQPLSNFYTSGLLVSGKPRIKPYCKGCSLARNRLVIGASKEIVDKLIDAQNNRCAICEKKLGKRFCVDHDHATGKVRGILCYRCNTGIGLLGDNADGIKKALEYLL